MQMARQSQFSDRVEIVLTLNQEDRVDAADPINLHTAFAEAHEMLEKDKRVSAISYAWYDKTIRIERG